MKKIYRGVLLVAFMLVAIFWCGTAEVGSGFFPAMLALAAIVALMAKAGMIAKPLTKEEVEKYYYGKKM